MKKIISVFVLMASMILICGCDIIEPEEKTFSNKGLTITLTEDFYEKDLVSVTSYYESKTAIVTALKESFSELEELDINQDSSLEEYAKLISYANQFDYNYSYQEIGDYLSFNYTKEVNGNDYYYYGVIKKGSDAFWLIHFACFEQEQAEYQPLFEKWARTIKLN